LLKGLKRNFFIETKIATVDKSLLVGTAVSIKIIPDAVLLSSSSPKRERWEARRTVQFLPVRLMKGKSLLLILTWLNPSTVGQHEKHHHLYNFSSLNPGPPVIAVALFLQTVFPQASACWFCESF